MAESAKRMSRRRALRIRGVAVAAPLVRLDAAVWAGEARTADRPLAQLTLWGPPAGPSITLRDPRTVGRRSR